MSHKMKSTVQCSAGKTFSPGLHADVTLTCHKFQNCTGATGGILQRARNFIYKVQLSICPTCKNSPGSRRPHPAALKTQSICYQCPDA